MQEIGLTQGQVALVDDEDYAYLSSWTWYAMKNKSGIWYAVSKPRNSPVILMHRVVMDRKLKGSNFELVDHVNNNGLDNRRSNLRPATKKQNAENRKGAQKNSKSGIRGVAWYKKTKKWRAQVGHEGRNISLGYFTRLEDAIAAVELARKIYFTHS